MRACGHSHVRCGASSGVWSIRMISSHRSGRSSYSSDRGLGVGTRSSKGRLGNGGLFSSLLDFAFA